MIIPSWSEDHNRGFIGGLYIRPFGPVSKGYVHEGHAHYIDHAMFVETGSVKVDWEKGSVVVESPNFLHVKAECSHRIEALEEGTRWRCIFAQAEAEKIEEVEGPIPFNMERVNV